MTLKELNRIKNLKCAIANMEERIARINSRLYPGGGSVDGMPHGSGDVHSTVDDTAIKRIELAERLEKLRKQYLDELETAMDFIESIDNLFVREIFMQRFVDGRSWAAVATRLGTTAGSAQELCYRYLKKIK